MIDLLEKKPVIIYTGGLILLIAALFINLGAANLFFGVDEATRALVTLEMWISDQILVPTINGDFYYNKPPLFNWILLVVMKLLGTDEFFIRMPSNLSLIGFGLTVYYFVSKHMGKKTGIVTAFMFVSSGRLLFWETFYAYIDITFSWVVYTGMMVIFTFYQRKKYVTLFILSWILTAIAYMLKGLPAIVFQGITLLVIFGSNKDIKKLFSWTSFLGGFVFIILIGSYYLLYHQHNDLLQVFPALWFETTQRTVLVFGWANTLKHIVKFPFEMTLHYAPWSFLVIFIFRNNFIDQIRKHPFLKFNLLSFLFNIIPYWTSPDVYPKYIIMLIPLIYTIYIYFFLKDVENQGNLSKLFLNVLFVLSVLLSVGYLSLPFIDRFDSLNNVYLKSFFLAVMTGLLSFLYFRLSKYRIILFAIIVITARIGFNWFILPERISQFDRYKEDALKVAEITGKEPVEFYKTLVTQYGVSYYISLETWKIVGRTYEEPLPNRYYLVDGFILKELEKSHSDVRVYYKFPNIQDQRFLHLIMIKPIP